MLPPIVEVLWEDAQSTDEWGDSERIEAFAQEACLVQSVGFLVHDDGQRVVLAQSQIQAGQPGTFIKIPRALVREIKCLRPREG